MYTTYTFEASWAENEAKQFDQYGEMSYGGENSSSNIGQLKIITTIST
jgi:hypothetical protein